MKKIISLSIIFIMVLSFATLGATQFQNIAVEFNTVNITVGGNTVQADNILYNGTTYVPLRAVAEMLGQSVEWNGETNTANINKDASAFWLAQLMNYADTGYTTGNDLSSYVVDLEAYRNALIGEFSNRDEIIKGNTEKFTKDFNKLVEWINSDKEQKDWMKKIAVANGIEVDFDKAFYCYDNAITNIKLAYEEINKYINTNNRENLGSANVYMSAGLNDALNGKSTFFYCKMSSYDLLLSKLI